MLFFIISVLILTASGVSVIGQEQQVVVPFTLADRDRIILIEAKTGSLETRMNSLEARMEDGFDNLQRQIDEHGTLFYWGFGIMITLFIFMLGYMIWDRRTAMKPALEQSTRALEDG
jgi:hypothetical protein